MRIDLKLVSDLIVKLEFMEMEGKLCKRSLQGLDFENNRYFKSTVNLLMCFNRTGLSPLKSFLLLQNEKWFKKSSVTSVSELKTLRKSVTNTILAMTHKNVTLNKGFSLLFLPYLQHHPS